MKNFKQFLVPSMFVIAISLIFQLNNMSDGAGKLFTYFVLALFPVLITQFSNVRKYNIDISPIAFAGLIISYTFITLFIAIIFLLGFNKI